MSHHTAHQIIKKDLQMSKVTAKFVPRVLTDEMKCTHKSMCQYNLKLFKDDPYLLSKIVTGDESQVSKFEIETK